MESFVGVLKHEVVHQHLHHPCPGATRDLRLDPNLVQSQTTALRSGLRQPRAMRLRPTVPSSRIATRPASDHSAHQIGNPYKSEPHGSHAVQAGRASNGVGRLVRHPHRARRHSHQAVPEQVPVSDRQPHGVRAGWARLVRTTSCVPRGPRPSSRSRTLPGRGRRGCRGPAGVAPRGWPRVLRRWGGARQ